LIDNKNRGLGPAKKPSPMMWSDNKPRDRHSLSAYSNKLASNNICDICGVDHNVVVISLENGGRIVTPSFRKEKVTRIKAGSEAKGKNILAF
jgi:hypothetical protein